MGKSELDILIRLKDAATAGLNKLKKGLDGLEESAQRLEQASAQLMQLGKAMTALGVAMIATAAVPIKFAADFEEGMSKVKALTNSTEDQFKALSKTALELGRTTKFTAREAADGMSFLAMAGFEAMEVVGAMPEVLKLASAANLELADAADITTNIMTGYGKEVGELEKVNDVLVASFTGANVNLQQLGEAMKFVGPVASAAGVSFEETAAAVSLLGNAGIQGSMAGTSLRGALVRILEPSKEARKLMDELGVSVQDSAGKFVGFESLVKQFEKGLADVGSSADRTGMLMTIFGQRAGPAMAALIGQGSQKLGEFVTMLEESGGTAQRVYDVMTDNVAFAFKELTSAISGLFIELGGPLLGITKALVSTLAKIITKVTEFLDMLGPFPTIVLGVVGALGLLVTILGVVTLTVGLLGTGLAMSIKGMRGWVTVIELASLAHKKFIATVVGGQLADKFGIIGRALNWFFKLVIVGAGKAKLAWQAMQVAVGGTGIGLILIALAAAVSGVWKAFEGAEEAKEQLRSVGDALEKEAEAFEKYKDTAIASTDDIRTMTKESLGDYRTAIQKAMIHHNKMVAALTAKSGEETWYGTLTKEAQEAKDKLPEAEKAWESFRDAYFAATDEMIDRPLMPEIDTKLIKRSFETMGEIIDKGTESLKERLSTIQLIYQERKSEITQIEDIAKRELALQELRASYYKNIVAAATDYYNQVALQVAQNIQLLGDEALAAGASAEEIIKYTDELKKSKEKLALSYKSINKALDESLKKERTFYNEVVKLTKQIAGEERSLADEMRELRRTQLTEGEQLEDVRQEAAEKTAAARAALEQGNFNLARDLANQAKGIYIDLANTSEEEFTANIQNVQKAGQLAIDALQRQRVEAEARWRQEQQNVQMLTTALGGVKSGIENLDKSLNLLTGDTDVTVRFDVIGTDDVVEAYNLLPDVKEIDVDVDPDHGAKSAIESIKRQLDSLSPKEVLIKPVLSDTGTQENRWGGLIKRFAFGGGVYPGYGGGDVIPSLLEPGEFVLRKEAVRKYGTAILNAMNNMRYNIEDSIIPRKFAFGGSVDPSFGSDPVSNSSEFNLSVDMRSETMPPKIKVLMRQVSEELERLRRRG